MEIQPYFNEEIITSSNVEIRVNPDDRARAKAVVDWSSAIIGVSDDESFAVARQAAASLKAMVDEIETSRKAAKTPFTAIGRAIDGAASGVATAVENEQKRVLALLSGYVSKLEDERKEEERRQAAAKMLAQAQAERKIREAKTDAEREIAQLALDLAADVAELDGPPEPVPGLVPGGRVNHTYEFELIDVVACVKAGCWRLVRWTLDARACQDAVKNLIECAPNVEPELPGIRVTKKINVSVKASSRIK